MSTELTLPSSFGKPPAVGGDASSVNDELGSGVASSYGIIGYKGKVWSMRFGGKDTPLMREDGDGARGSIEVVIVKASAAISKIYYAGGYVEGSTAAPDCWSANGVTPDSSVQKKCNATCVDCPMNAWGSRITDAGKPGKACADSRRVAVVPVDDIQNELFGGPMLLRVPAASLKDLKAYGELLSSYQYPYYAAATRISFDTKEAFPKFVFSAMRPLVEDELAQITALREDKRVAMVLNETIDGRVAAPATAPAALPASPFESQAEAPKKLSERAAASEPVDLEAARKKSALDAKRKAARDAAAEAARLAALAEEEDEVEEDTSEGNDGAVSSFDDALNSLL